MKKFLSVLVLFSLIFVSCGKNVEQDTESTVKDTESFESVIETSTNSFSALEGDILFYGRNFSSDVVLMEDGKTYEADLSEIDGNSTAYGDGYLVFYNYSGGDDPDCPCNIIVADLKNGGSYETVMQLGNIEYVDYYKDVFHVISYSEYKAGSVAYGYDPKTGKQVDINQSIYDEIDDYRLKTFALDATGTKASMERLMDTAGYVVVTQDDKVYIYNGDSFHEICDYTYDMDFVYYDKDVIIMTYDTYETNSTRISKYDVAGDAWIDLVSNVDRVLACKDGFVYYSVCDDTEYGMDVNKIWSVDIKNLDTKLITSIKKIPGSMLLRPGVEGFSVVGDSLIFLGDNDEGVCWMVAPKDSLNVSATPVRNVKNTSPLREYGKAEALSKSIKCDKCGEYINRTYIEYFVFNEDVIKNADALNKALYDDAALTETEEGGYVDESEDCEYHRDYDVCYTYEENVNAIKKLGTHYLQLESSAYAYSGGAHGYPFLGHRLIDVNTGESIKFADVYKGTEEELKEIFAKATVAVYEDADAEYIPFYSDDPDDLYAEAYEYVSFNTVYGYFTEEGFVLEYPPYAMGPYAAGFIEIPVTYEELSLENIDKW